MKRKTWQWWRLFWDIIWLWLFEEVRGRTAYGRIAEVNKQMADFNMNVGDTKHFQVIPVDAAGKDVTDRPVVSTVWATDSGETDTSANDNTMVFKATTPGTATITCKFTNADGNFDATPASIEVATIVVTVGGVIREV